jgi:hypothetical protein
MSKFLLAALAVLMTVPAYATEATTTIDLSGPLTAVVQLVATALLGLGGVLITKMTQKFHLESQANMLNDALVHACNSAEAAMIKQAGSSNLTAFDTHNAAVAAAYQFLQATVPAVLKSQNLSEENVAQMISGYFARNNPAVILPGTIPLTSEPVKPVEPVTAANSGHVINAAVAAAIAPALGGASFIDPNK